MKRLLALSALCIPIYLFAQGFGSFSHDQPYLAKNLSGVTPLPNQAGLKFRLVASDVANGTVTNWTDRIAGLVMGQGTAGSEPSKLNGGVYFTNQNQSDFKALTNDLVTFFATTNALMVVTSNAFPINHPTVAKNRGVFWNGNTTGAGLRLQSNSVGGVTFGWANGSSATMAFTMANYGADMPQGIQAMLFISLPGDAWRCYTNGVISAVGTNTSVNASLGMIGRNAPWPDAASFRGYVMEAIIWSNSPSMTTNQIIEAFQYVTSTYGNFGP